MLTPTSLIPATQTTDTEATSSGWRYLSDMELARKFADRDLHGDGWLAMGFTLECDVRGLKILECAECAKVAVIAGHDYKCLICRASE